MISGRLIAGFQMTAGDGPGVPEDPAEGRAKVALAAERPSRIRLGDRPAIDGESTTENLGPGGAVTVFPDAGSFGENGTTEFAGVPGGDAAPGAFPGPGKSVRGRLLPRLGPPPRPSCAGGLCQTSR